VPGDALLAAFQTPIGATTDPVKTPQGYYVMKVLERVPADPSGFATEKEKVTRELLTQKQGQAWQAWVERARAGAKVETTPPPKVLPRRG
jgi:parvulin-like peptidyl-prolyl isomerase